jgi:hypothetical protein
MEVLKAAAPHHLDSVRAHVIDLLSPTEIKSFTTAFTKIADKLSEE